MRTAVIIQPTYLPWMGYFDLMDQCDAFVLLDCVQFEKRSWQQRNQIKTPQGATMLTVPVFSKGRHTQRIVDVAIDFGHGFPEKHIKSVERVYRRARYYDRYAPEWAAILNKRHSRLVDLNIELITWFAAHLGITREFTRSSTLAASGGRVERLISICRHLGADRYVSPPGSKAYIDQNNCFADCGIELRYHAFQHPVYRQLHGDFIGYLSVLDLLLNEGPDSVAILRSGRLPPSVAPTAGRALTG
jgi:hypothetical protein